MKSQHVVQVKLVNLFSFIMIICSVSLSHAEEGFDPNYANKLLDKLSIELSIAQPTYENLQKAADKLLDLKGQADLCVSTTQTKLDEINKALPENATDETLSKDKAYLKQKKISLNQQLSECRLFSLRADEAISAYTKAAQTLQRSEIFSRGPNLLLQLGDDKTKLPHMMSTWRQAIAKYAHTQGIGADYISFIMIMGMLGFVSALWLRKRLANLLETIKASGLGSQLIQTLLASMKAHAYGCVLIFAFVAYGITLFSLDRALDNYVTVASYLLGLLIYIFLVEFLFYPPKPALAYFHITPSYAQKFASELKFFGVLVFCTVILLDILDNYQAKDALYYLSRGVMFTCLALVLGKALLTLNQMPKFLSHYKSTRQFISSLIMIFIFIILMAEWAGFQALASYLLVGVSLTVLSTILCYMINDWLQEFLTEFNQGQQPWHALVKEQIGLKANDNLPEFIGLRAGIFLLIWGGYFIILISLWQLSHVLNYSIWQSLEQGFVIPGTEVTLVPSRFILGFIVFAVGILATRFFRNQIQSKVRNAKDKAEREAYSAIFGYSCFVFVVIIALIVAGFDLQGLAIIAGALSLGIGFGLQNIVNNFISGIILLLERPIKPGDRIALGEDEGFVKSVNIRSTCITTLENNDVIVPNGQLISSQVINQTFKNYHWRVTIEVGVAYGSDVKLVEQCLYDAAMNHPEVIKDGPDAPKVFFLEFGDSSLNFEMWCIIRNVNLKLFVLSDINFAITQSFEKHGIEIPFPQRDIHIKSSTTNENKGVPPDEG